MAPKRSFNEYQIVGNITKIFIDYKGKRFESLIDTDDLDKLLEFGKRWNLYYSKSARSFYVTTAVYQKTVNKKPKYLQLRLHNFILNKKRGTIGDHKNHDTLDNRKENLRSTSKANNIRNRRTRNSNNTSGHRNVSWINGCWRVQLQKNGTNYCFPEKFDDVNEAGKFAEEMRKKYYGEFAGNN